MRPCFPHNFSSVLTVKRSQVWLRNGWCTLGSLNVRRTKPFVPALVEGGWCNVLDRPDRHVQRTFGRRDCASILVLLLYFQYFDLSFSLLQLSSDGPVSRDRFFRYAVLIFMQVAAVITARAARSLRPLSGIPRPPALGRAQTSRSSHRECLST